MRRRLVLLSFAGIPLASGCTALMESIDDGDDSANGTAPTDDDTVTFGDVIQLEESYAIEMSLDDEGTTGTLILTVDGANFSQEFVGESPDESFTVYSIDGDNFLVIEDMCYYEPGGDDEPDSPEAETFEEDIDHNLESVGITEIDGHEMHQFEADDAELDTTVTYYVARETGYLRRVESVEFTVDFHSWGAVDSIERPELECYEIDEIPDSEIEDLPEENVHSGFN